MPNSAVVTASLGPGMDLETTTIEKVTRVDFQLQRNVIGITYGEVEKTQYFDYDNVSNVTFTVSAAGTIVTIVAS